jgi:putative transposase
MTSYPQRHSTRLKQFDYASEGMYFVTLCIEGRLPLLGAIVEGEMRLSSAGQMVTTAWENLERYYPGVALDSFVVMPNHLHGIVALTGADRDRAAVPTPALSLSTLVQRFKTFTAYEYGTGVRDHSPDSCTEVRTSPRRHTAHPHVHTCTRLMRRGTLSPAFHM